MKSSSASSTTPQSPLLLPRPPVLPDVTLLPPRRQPRPPPTLRPPLISIRSLTLTPSTLNNKVTIAPPARYRMSRLSYQTPRQRPCRLSWRYVIRLPGRLPSGGPCPHRRVLVGLAKRVRRGQKVLLQHRQGQLRRQPVPILLQRRRKRPQPRCVRVTPCLIIIPTHFCSRRKPKMPTGPLHLQRRPQRPRPSPLRKARKAS